MSTVSDTDSIAIDWSACTDYPDDYDRDRYRGYFEAEQERHEAELAQEEAYALAEADHASGEADIAPGIHLVRTTGDFDEQGDGWIDARPVHFMDHSTNPSTDRFDDDEYDRYDALIDGRPRW